MDQNASARELDQPGQRLLRLLISWLPNVMPNDPRTFLGYKRVHEELDLSQIAPTFGESLQKQGLNSLAEWTERIKAPAITGIIIDTTSKMPGPGYFKLFGRKPDSFEWWASEVQKAKEFDWSFCEPTLSTNSVVGGDWNEHELRAAVQAYLEMQQLSFANQPFTKSSYYDELSSKFSRSPKAFEYRMQNISYVLSLMGRSWLTGLKPAKNVGARVGQKIELLIHELEGSNKAPIAAFEIEVRDALKKGQKEKPNGNRAPKGVETYIIQYARDNKVKAWVLKAANGICECCREPAPFLRTDGNPYLEVHHVRNLADKGSDTIENAVAICPNCHRALHYSMGTKELIESLYVRVERLVRE